MLHAVCSCVRLHVCIYHSSFKYPLMRFESHTSVIVNIRMWCTVLTEHKRSVRATDSYSHWCHRYVLQQLYLIVRIESPVALYGGTGSKSVFTTNRRLRNKTFIAFNRQIGCNVILNFQSL